MIKDVSQNFTQNCLAHASIQIHQINDHEIHQDWIDLFDDKGDILEGKILVEFQWILSEVFDYFGKFFISEDG